MCVTLSVVSDTFLSGSCQKTFESSCRNAKVSSFRLSQLRHAAEFLVTLRIVHSAWKKQQLSSESSCLLLFWANIGMPFWANFRKIQMDGMRDLSPVCWSSKVDTRTPAKALPSWQRTSCIWCSLPFRLTVSILHGSLSQSSRNDLKNVEIGPLGLTPAAGKNLWESSWVTWLLELIT